VVLPSRVEGVYAGEAGYAGASCSWIWPSCCASCPDLSSIVMSTRPSSAFIVSRGDSKRASSGLTCNVGLSVDSVHVGLNRTSVRNVGRWCVFLRHLIGILSCGAVSHGDGGVLGRHGSFGVCHSYHRLAAASLAESRTFPTAQLLRAIDQFDGTYRPRGIVIAKLVKGIMQWCEGEKTLMHEVVANIARGGGFGVEVVGEDHWLLPRSPSELNLIDDRLVGLSLNKNLTAKFSHAKTTWKLCEA